MTEAEFEEQVTAMTSLMYYVASGLLASLPDQQDAIQESIWRAWRSLSGLRDERAFRPWLMRILVRQCRSLGRRKGRELPVEQVADTPQPDVSEHLARNDALAQAMRRLPEKQRRTMIMVLVNGFSYDEAARALAVPIGTVKSRVNHGKARLRQMLGEEV